MLSEEDQKRIKVFLTKMFQVRQWTHLQDTKQMDTSIPLIQGTTDTGRAFACHYFDAYGIKLTKNVTQMCLSNGIEHLVLVLGKCARTPPQTWMKESGLTFEIFLPYQVSYDPLAHPLQPTFAPLTMTQKREWMESFGFTESSIPKMLRDDVVRRYYNWSPGTLVKVTSASSISYRLVE